MVAANLNRTAARTVRGNHRTGCTNEYADHLNGFNFEIRVECLRLTTGYRVRWRHTKGMIF